MRKISTWEETNDMSLQLEEHKEKLNAKHLQLQNLLYEKQHYQREIRDCQSFQ